MVISKRAGGGPPRWHIDRFGVIKVPVQATAVHPCGARRTQAATVSRSRSASPRISENSRSVSSTCSLFLMPLETGFAAAFPGPSSHSITRSYRGSAMFRLLPAIEPAFEIHMPPNAGTSDPDSGRPYILQGFSCKPRPPTVALMNSEFRLFIIFLAGCRLRPTAAKG
jgi:hypothetical protein